MSGIFNDGISIFKLVDHSVSKSTVCRESKSVCRVIVYSGKHKTLPFPQWKQSEVVNMTQGSWLIAVGNIVILSTRWCSLLLTVWALSSDCDHINLSELKSMMLSSCIIPATVATLFTNPLGSNSDDCKRA